MVGAFNCEEGFGGEGNIGRDEREAELAEDLKNGARDAAGSAGAKMGLAGNENEKPVFGHFGSEILADLLEIRIILGESGTGVAADL